MPSKEFTRFRQLVRDQLHRVKGSLLVALLSTLGVTLLELAQPWPLKIIFDHILLNQPLPRYVRFLEPMMQQGKLLPLVVVSSSIVLIAVALGMLSYLQIYITSRLGNEMVYMLRREVFGHLQRLSLTFHNRARSGELLMKVTGDTSAMKDVFAESILAFVAQVLTFTGMFAIMFAMSWKLGLIVLATLPVLFWNLMRVYHRSKSSAKLQRDKEELMATRISEALATVQLVQAFGREGHEVERFETESTEYREESTRNARIEAVASRTVEIIGAIATCAVVLTGSWQVLQGQMTLGSVLIFTKYLHGMYRPVRNLAKLSSRFSKAIVSARRIAEILDVEPEMQDDPNAVEASNLRGEIVFDNVSFDYGDGKTVLRNISFAIAGGQQVALVGASGSGKSTLASLILRFYDPTEGSIRIDGLTIKMYRRESLRRAVGIVLQDSLLLGATIQENIAYGKLDATPAEIEAAARAANAHDFIVELDDGYETVLGERGSTLSGGQRRRLSIARTIIRNSPILILDEPMTGLDVESEAKVQEALSHLTAGKTCLMITHDLQAVADADLVLVLDRGQLIECGKHHDLMVSSNYYRRLCELQFGRPMDPEFAIDEPTATNSADKLAQAFSG